MREGLVAEGQQCADPRPFPPPGWEGIVTLPTSSTSLGGLKNPRRSGVPSTPVRRSPCLRSVVRPDVRAGPLIPFLTVGEGKHLVPVLPHVLSPRATGLQRPVATSPRRAGEGAAKQASAHATNARHPLPAPVIRLSGCLRRRVAGPDAWGRQRCPPHRRRPQKAPASAAPWSPSSA